MSVKISKYLKLEEGPKRGRSSKTIKMIFTDKDGKSAFDLLEDEEGEVDGCVCYVSSRSAKKLIKELQELVE